jgi:hypothetical protein
MREGTPPPRAILENNYLAQDWRQSGGTPHPLHKVENNLRGFMQYCQSFRQIRSGA